MKYKIVNVLVLLFIFNNCFSQQSNTGNWLAYSGNNKIAKKWNWHNEIQYRNYNAIGDLEQLLLRTGLGYNLTENNNNLLLGYAFIVSEKYLNNKDKIQSKEHRVFQQFITRQRFNRLYLQHRYRIEERFLEDDFKLRLRYFLSLNIPITKKEMIKNTLYLSVYNEMFANATSPVFDRDRLYGGIGYIINKDFKIEAGFMRQIQEKQHREQFQITVYNTISFFNK